jgi:hypothetical protein
MPVDLACFLEGVALLCVLGGLASLCVLSLWPTQKDQWGAGGGGLLAVLAGLQYVLGMCHELTMCPYVTEHTLLLTPRISVTMLKHMLTRQERGCASSL